MGGLMLRVTTIHASVGGGGGVARYLTGYYVSAGEEAGVWRPSAAAQKLGVAGTVDREQLELLIEGRHPGTGEILGTRFNTDPDSGRRSVAGFDATFSAPKSVSVMWALSGDRVWLDAHDAAVTAALDVLERYGCTTRIGPAGGQAHVDAGGLVAATFRQHTSRSLDPQIHTHCYLSTKVPLDDGRWRALDARWLKQQQASLGHLYQHALRAEVVSRTGYLWGPVVNGCAELDHLPTRVLQAYSTRTGHVDTLVAERVEAFRQEHGVDPTRYQIWGITRDAALASRPAKAHDPAHGLTELRDEWRARLTGLGLRVEDYTRITPAQLELGLLPVEDRSLAAVARAGRVWNEQVTQVEAVLSQRSTWGRGEILKAAATIVSSQPGDTAAEAVGRVEAWADRYIGERCIDLDPVDPVAVRRVSDGRDIAIAPNEIRYTTPTILDQETRITVWADHALTAPARPSTTIPPGTGLDIAQRAVAAAVAGQDPLVLVIGPAGTGKTTSLRAAVEDLNEQGRGQVLAVATTAKAAGELHDAVGIPTDTLAKLLYEYANPHPVRGVDPRLTLPAEGTVIVDEAGMVNTGDLAHLAELADHHRWRVALIGDPYQLAAVGRSGMFAHLTTTASRVHELATVRRFDHEWEATASLQLRLGQTAALDVYQAHGRIRGYEWWGDVVDDTVLTWADHQRAGRSVAVSVTTREEAHNINTAIQARRLDLGQLTDPFVAGRDGYQLHAGDQIATRRNNRDLVTDRGEWVKNRAVWTIDTLHDDGAITATGGLGTVRLPADYTKEQVELAYAATTYGTIGGTFDASISVIAHGAHARGLYTGVTRGHDHNLVIVHTDPGQPALDRLNVVMRTDPADTPAITHLPHHHQPPTPAFTAAQQPARRDPEPEPVRLVARADVPDWFPDLVDDLHHDLDRAYAEQQRIVERRQKAAVDYQELAPVVEQSRQAIVGPRQEIFDAYDLARAAQERVWAASAAQRQAHGFFERRRTEHALNDAVSEHQNLAADHRAIGERHQPVITNHQKLVDQLAWHQVNQDETLLDRYRTDPAPVEQKLDALDIWRNWATGKPVTETDLATAVITLRDTAVSNGLDWETRGQYQELAVVLTDWAHDHQVRLPDPPVLRIEPPSFGIELDF